MSNHPTFNCGDVLGDMHYGLYRITEKLDCDVDYNIALFMEGGSDFIDRNIEQRYLNKELVVINTHRDGKHYVVQAVYSYDGMRFGIVQLRFQ